MKLKKELLAYLVSGGITTGVNYCLYTALLYLNLPWLSSNSIAWAGAVLAAYLLNRRWVFHSENSVRTEMASFVGARFLTLLTRKCTSLAVLLIHWASRAGSCQVIGQHCNCYGKLHSLQIWDF